MMRLTGNGAKPIKQNAGVEADRSFIWESPAAARPFFSSVLESLRRTGCLWGQLSRS